MDRIGVPCFGLGLLLCSPARSARPREVRCPRCRGIGAAGDGSAVCSAAVSRSISCSAVLLGVLAQLLLGYVFPVLRPQLPAALLISFGLRTLPHRLIGVGSADDDLALSGDPMAGDCHVIAQLDLLAQFEGLALVRIGLGGNLAAEFLPVPAEAGVFRHRSPRQRTVGVADVIFVAERLGIPALGVPDLRFLRLGFLFRLAFADRFFGNAPLRGIDSRRSPAACF